MSETRTCVHCQSTITRTTQSTGTWSRVKYCPALECRKAMKRDSERRARARRKAKAEMKPKAPRPAPPVIAEDAPKVEATRRGLEAWLERVGKSAQLQRQKDQMRKRGAYI